MSTEIACVANSPLLTSLRFGERFSRLGKCSFFFVVRRELVSNKLLENGAQGPEEAQTKNMKRPAAYLRRRRELRVTDQAESQ